MFDLKNSTSQTIDVDLNITIAQNIFQQALEKIGSYKDTDYKSADSVVLKGKSRYGLQGVPLLVQLDKTSETTTKVTIGGKSDDVGGVGAKKCIVRLISTFNTLNSNDSQQIQELESTSSFQRKTGFTKKKLFLLVAGFIIILVIVMNSGGSSGPAGKSWMSPNGWTEYSFGDSYGKADNYLNYSKLVFDRMGNPVRNIHRTGTFTVNGNTINCNFNDGQPPYKLEYKKVNGEWCVVDENGQAFIWDDPAKRSIK